MHPRQERRDHPETRAHPRHQFIRRGSVDDVGSGNAQGLTLIFAIACPLADRGDVDAVIAEDALQLCDIGKARHIVEDQGFLAEQPPDHQGQCGVLRARNRDGAVELAAARDANAIHYKFLLLSGANYRADTAKAKAAKFAAIMRLDAMRTSLRGARQREPRMQFACRGGFNLCWAAPEMTTFIP